MDLLFLAHFFNGFLMVALPILLGVFLTRKLHLGWRLWWIGAAAFILSQAGHIPFNWLATVLFQRGILPNPPRAWSPYFNPVFLGLSAGLWETFARWGVYRWWADDARSWRKGVLLGAGHGGMEALILGMLVLFNFAFFAALRNISGPNALVPASQFELAKQQIDAYWSAPFGLSMLGALERALTIPFHIGVSVIVLQAFTRRQPAWIALAVALHALADGTVIFLSGVWANQAWKAYALEGVVAVFALIALAITFALRTPEVEEVPAGPIEPVVAPPIQQLIKPRDLTSEDLDDSRYSSR